MLIKTPDVKVSFQRVVGVGLKIGFVLGLGVVVAAAYQSLGSYDNLLFTRSMRTGSNEKRVNLN